jgi:hypothetical protein
MLDGIYYAYATALFLLCVGYIVGYIVGRLDLIYRTLSTFRKMENSQFAKRESRQKKPRDFFSEEPAAPKTKIEIDERKYVSAIKTDDLARTNDKTLGKITTTEDDIGASVSKLAQLKGK